MKNNIDRRSFLHSAAGVMAASSVAAAASDDVVRTAYIGVGKRGSTLLNVTLKQPNVELAAVCDIDPAARDRAQSAAARDNPRSFTDYRQVLDLNDVDAVYIATPCYLHAEMAAAALDAGKHVYCEKPLGISADQVRMVVDAAKKSNKFLQIGQQLRYSPVMNDVVSQIHEKGLIGRPLVIKAQRHSTPSRPGSRRVDASGVQRRRPAWYDDVKRSGDLIVENAVHNIDACNWLAGSHPLRAFGHGKKYLPEPIPAGTVMMDGFSVQYVYANDMHTDYSQLYLHPRALKSLPNGQWYVIYGEKGTISLTHSKWTFFDMWGENEPIEFEPTDEYDLTENAQQAFFNSVRENKKPFADINVAATAALTAIMGREAIYQKRMTTWEEMNVSL